MSKLKVGKLPWRFVGDCDGDYSIFSANNVFIATIPQDCINRLGNVKLIINAVNNHGEAKRLLECLTDVMRLGAEGKKVDWSYWIKSAEELTEKMKGE